MRIAVFAGFMKLTISMDLIRLKTPLNKLNILSKRTINIPDMRHNIKTIKNYFS